MYLNRDFLINFLERNKGKEIKVMVSQPMSGLTSDEVLNKRQAILDKLSKCIGDRSIDINLIDSYFKELPEFDNPLRSSVWCLGDSIKLMADADLIIFSEDFVEARGCHMEWQIAKEYPLLDYTFEYILDGIIKEV